MDPPMNVLLCTCEVLHAVDEETVSAVRTALEEAGIGFEHVDDLCGLAARRDERLAHLAGTEHVAVVACYPRAVRWMFAAAGTPLNEGQTQLLNMHEDSPEDIVRRLAAGEPSSSSASPAEAPAPATPAPIPTDWTPWFPVIDYDRCIGCRQCMDFCLFGVFELDADERVVVCRPNNCKTHCPACGRICPTSAIMFPKHAEAPINGAEPDENAGAVAGVDMAKALGADLYATLRRRSTGQRFAPKDARAQAEAERYRCAACKVLGERLGVAPEVVESAMADCGAPCACHAEPPGNSAPDRAAEDSPPGCDAGNADCCCDGPGRG